MPRCHARGTVAAPLETVWAVLLDKMERPQRYLEGVLDYRILEEAEDHVIRELALVGERWLRERVEVDPDGRRITFRLEDHPTYEGHVSNQVAARPDGGVEMTFEMDWRPRPGLPEDPEDPSDLIHRAFARTQEIAEELARVLR